jgi:histidinol dehydrogenase
VECLQLMKPLSFQEALKLFPQRLKPDDATFFADVQKVLDEVRLGGDEAAKALTLKFDGVRLKSIRVPAKAFRDADKKVSQELKTAIALAAKRVRAFYEHQPKEGFIWQDGGALLGQITRPLERVACYVPGGQVPLFSTLLMTAIPAQVAGVPEIVVAIPANKSGQVSPEVLVTARLLGLDEVYCLGGPVAIAALAYGTESIRRVDKIVGPGSRYTMAAKKLVYGDVGIEALPGPTETMVIADESADIGHVAADLLAQAEHDAAQPVLVTTSAKLFKTINKVLEETLSTLPTKAMAYQSITERGYRVKVTSLDEALEVANSYAPEHLCLLVKEPWNVVPKVKHAGGIFIGEHGMEALGDYMAGPSHVIPTGGRARFFSAVNVRDFQKVIPFLSMDYASFEAIAPAAATMARAEGLEAHARALESRLSKAKDKK